MLLSFAVILIASVGSRAQDPPVITSSTGCICVFHKLCWEHNRTIITDGSTGLTERFRPGEYEECVCPSNVDRNGERCEGALHICCHLPDQPATAPPAGETTSTTEEPDMTWDDCGIKGFSLPGANDRVINTDDKSLTYSKEFPWMAMLLRKSDQGLLCGASILHHHVILTAAHCVRRFQSPDILVRVGVWNRNELAQSTTVEVERIIRHDDFGTDNYWNDIALLVLKQGLTLSDSVGPICLPEPNANYDNMVCTATGWGRTNYEDKNPSDYLLKVDLNIVPHKQCEREMRRTRVGLWFILDKSFVCAKGGNGADTCIGDGGGPLVCRQPGTETYVQVGIVATGIECGEDRPALYANIPHLMPWINQKFEQWKLKSFQ